MRKTYVAGIALAALLTGQASAQQIEKPNVKTATSFAIVVDAATYSQAKEEIKAYKAAVEQGGLGTYIISHAWSRPDEIRSVLNRLYQQSPRLEGAVLVGNIPVPMIRDAQYLTSAFKMDQRRNWQASSVPSDRYYDDFDLKFNYIKQDSLKKSFFYYSLDATSPQVIGMDIYSARIKPPVEEGENPVEKIKAFLVKAVKEKKQQNKLNDFFVFTGHGYNSQSLNAWAGEQISLREQFSELFRPGNTVKFMNYRMNPHMKFMLMSEVQREDLDMAVFHDHGSDDMQLLNGTPDAGNPVPSIENVKRYLRSKVRAAKERKGGDVEKTKKGFVESLGVPMAWMEDAFVDSVVKADSIFDANLNIALPDIKNIKPNARFVMVDACLTGSYQLDDYLAGHYPFGKGKTVVALANSVGVLQDLWPDEMLGLLQYGVRLGNWMKHVAYLETHLFGDPTYAFSGRTSVDLNAAIVLQKGNAVTWEGLLKHASPDVQTLALEKLAKIKGTAAAPLLKQQYFSSPYGVVRMQALKQLSKINNKDYHEVLKAAIFDTYEFVRRQAGYLLADIGSEEMIRPAVELYLTDRHSKRVAGKAKDALDFMDSKKVLEQLPVIFEAFPYMIDKDSELAALVKDQQYVQYKLDRDMKVIMDKTKPVKERIAEINILRNYNYHVVVPDVIRLAQDPAEDEGVRLAVVEALGWFFHSYQKEKIMALCNQLISDAKAPAALKSQAIKTKNILLAQNLSLKEKGVI